MGTQESESEVGVSCGDRGGLGENVRKGGGRGLRRDSWRLEDVRVKVEKVNDYCQTLQDIHFFGSSSALITKQHYCYCW